VTAPDDPFAAPGPQEPQPPSDQGTPPPGYGVPPAYGAPRPGYGVPPGHGPPPPGYGQPAGYPYPYGPPYQQKPGTNTLAIVGFILSLPIVCPLIGTVLCVIALNQIKRTGEGGKGLAIAGIAISIGLIVVFAGLVIVGAVLGDSSSGY
jgi:hypothetical protein